MDDFVVSLKEGLEDKRLERNLFMVMFLEGIDILN